MNVVINLVIDLVINLVINLVGIRTWHGDGVVYVRLFRTP